MFSGSPWRLVVEQQADERLHGDVADEARFVAEPLVDQPAQSLQPFAGACDQPGPGVA